MMAEGFETPTGANSGLQFGSSANEGASFAKPGGVCGGLKGGGEGEEKGMECSLHFKPRCRSDLGLF